MQRPHRLTAQKPPLPPQRKVQLAHYYLTGSATVDGNAVTMLEDNGSANAEAPLTIVNSKGFDLPKTGDSGVWMYSVIGITLMAGAMAVMFIAFKKKGKRQ